MEKTQYQLSIIGSGNVAYQLCKALADVPFVSSITVYARSQNNNALFSSLSNKVICKDLSSFSDSADLHIISVSDDSIGHVAKNLGQTKNPVVHTAGSVSSDILAIDNIQLNGVLYPLQTFSLQKNVNWNEIPILINSRFENVKNLLLKIAQSISDHVEVCSDSQRLQAHIAAVFTNNFTNYLQLLSDEWLKKHDLSFDLLKPLLKETVHKLDQLTPIQAQTGPAKRNDIVTIQKHIDQLNAVDQKEFLRVYALLTSCIQEKFNQ